MSTDPDMLDRRLRECDALGAAPSPLVLRFAAAACGLGLAVTLDPINRAIVVEWRGLKRMIAWTQAELNALGPEGLAVLVRQETLTQPEAKDGAR